MNCWVNNEHGIQLHLNDCIQQMKDIEDHSIDMICVDPPRGTTRCKWDSIIPLDLMWEQLIRVVKSNGIIVITASQPFSSRLVMSNPNMFKHEWIWIKNRGSNFANTVREPMKEHEHVLIFSNGKWTYNKQMQERTGGGLSLVGKRVGTGKKQREGIGNFKDFTSTKSLSKLRIPSSWQKFNTEVGLHPTQKPVDLMEYLIRTYTNENETVLDFAMGSGTTGIACIKTKRKFIGIELEDKFFQIAIKRLDEFIQAVK